MHKLFLSLGLLCLCNLSLAQELSETDKQVLLGKIEVMENDVLDFNYKNQKAAATAFKAAMQSETKAFQFYLDCKERIDQEAKKQKGSDLRADMKKLRDSTTNEKKRALRHQLVWLVASMEAAANPDARETSAQKLVDGLKNIIDDAQYLDRKTVTGRLKQNPFSSEFAKAYLVDHIKPDNWPSSPLDYDGLFKNLIIKGLVESGKYNEARSEWQNRLQAEQRLIEEFDVEPETDKFGKESVELDNFLQKTLPDLRWQMEQELFTAGDTRQASVALFSILQTYPKHDNYLKWVNWFKGALSPESEASK